LRGRSFVEEPLTAVNHSIAKNLKKTKDKKERSKTELEEIGDET